jgi:integrase
LGAAAAGTDPVRAKQDAQKAGVTVGEVCDWYIREAEAGRLLRRNGRPIKASTLDSDKGRIEHHIKPLLGSRAVRGLTVRDLEGMQADIAAGKTAKPIPKKQRPRGGIAIGGGGVATRTLALAHAIFGHAKRLGLIHVNPASGARKGAQKKRKDRLTLEQLRELGKAMASCGENTTGVAAIRFMLMTGFRRNEALGIRPEWILPQGGVDLPDTKAGPQVRPIGKDALALLRAQVTSDDQEWVFPADRGNGHFVGLPKVLRRLAKEAKIRRATPHLLRHTFASIAGDLGMSELVIAGLMGHSAGTVTSAYVHLDVALVTAADRVARVVARALDGKSTGAVVPLRRKKA